MPPTPVTLRTPLLERSTDYDDVQLTEDEQREYDRDLLTWETARDWRFWIRREWMPLYFAGVVLLAAVSFVAIYHREVSVQHSCSGDEADETDHRAAQAHCRGCA
jgi:hypothetical protein